MPLTSLMPWIFAAVVASIAAMVTGIRTDLPLFTWCASGLFAVALVATAVDVNMTWWRRPADKPGEMTPVDAAIGNARLLVVAYAWGAVALLAIYRMTPLRWQHGLQYGAGMALVAWLVLLYAQSLSNPESRLRGPRALLQAAWLSIAHAGAALGGLSFLLVSGKIASVKDDWGANQIFLAGGLAVAALSIVSAYTQFRLMRPAGSGHPVGSAGPG